MQTLTAPLALSLPRTRTRARTARWLLTGARVALGLVFLVFGADYFLELMPRPTAPLSDAAMAFAGGLAQSGYMFPLIKGLEVLVGILLLGNRFVPLALVLLAPVLVNIVAFHVFLVPSGLGFALLLVALEIVLAWAHRDAYRPLLAFRATRAA